jgi:hypothetical protein
VASLLGGERLEHGGDDDGAQLGGAVERRSVARELVDDRDGVGLTQVVLGAHLGQRELERRGAHRLAPASSARGKRAQNEREHAERQLWCTTSLFLDRRHHNVR